MKVLALLGILLMSGGAARPTLRPLDLDPLTLAGSGFRANERVTLLVAAPPVVKSTKVRANARGRFRIVFRVRVGKYEDRKEAETIAKRLEKEEQFKPWITR